MPFLSQRARVLRYFHQDESSTTKASKYKAFRDHAHFLTLSRKKQNKLYHVHEGVYRKAHNAEYF